MTFVSFMALLLSHRKPGPTGEGIDVVEGLVDQSAGDET